MHIRLIETSLAIGRYRQVRLPTVAAELAPYCDVSINDENIEPVDFSPADAVGITAQAYNAPRAVAIAAEFRRRGIPVFAGGPYATAMAQRGLAHFDAVVAGEVEGLGEALVRDAAAGKLKGVYRSQAPPEQWGLVPPRRDLQKSEKYYWINYPVEFSRGCPHRCSFCFCRHGQPGYRPRPLPGIEADLARWDHGLIEAVDFHLAADRKHTLEVCRLLAQARVWGWYGEATLVSLKDAGLVSAMAKSGCKAIFVGIESIEPAALAAANKSFNQVEEYRDLIRRVQDQGIFVHAGLVWGLAGQSSECFEETARFCERTGIYLASTNIATFFPGTPEFTELCAGDKITETDERAFDGMHVTVAHETLAPEQIEEGARAFARRFYSLSSIFTRSFQAACYSYQQLFDYWMLNLIYRSYYRWWSGRLGGRKPFRRGEGYPFCGGRMPAVYALADRSWRAFHRFYQKWLAPPEEASLPTTAALCLAWALAGWVGYFSVRGLRADHWPLAFPPAAPVVFLFATSVWVSAFLAARGSRSGPAFFRLAAGLTAVSPLFAFAAVLPRTSSGWAFLLSLYATLMAQKAVSLALSASVRRASNLSAAWFLLFHPSLVFEGAYEEESSRLPVARLLVPWMAAWLWVLSGAFLWGATVWFSLNAPFFPGRDQAGYLLRLLCLYCLGRGFLQALTVWWRGWGFAVPDGFGPGGLLPTGPSGLWRAWFPAFHRWLLSYVYLPLGGGRCPALAALATFFLSGCIAALVMAPALGSFPWPVPLFFLANGAVVAMEKGLSRGRGEKAWYVLAVVVFFPTAGWFFNTTDRMFG
ncbi:MAG: radical SAM protein [Thermodesulfobacteriota bacterium]